MSGNLLNHENYRHIAIDPLSGRYQAALALTSITANKGMGPVIDLSLRYDQARAEWMFPFSYVQDNKLYMASGDVYPFDKKGLDLVNYKYDFPEKNILQVYHKDGTVERLREVLKEGAGSFYLVHKVVTKLGYSVEVDWDVWESETRSIFVLKSVKDEFRDLVKFERGSVDEKTGYLRKVISVYPGTSSALTYLLDFEDVSKRKKNTVHRFNFTNRATKEVQDDNWLIKDLKRIALEGTLLNGVRAINYSQEGYVTRVEAPNIGQEIVSSSTEGKVVQYEYRYASSLNLQWEMVAYTRTPDGDGTKVIMNDRLSTSKPLVVQYFNGQGVLFKEERTVDGVVYETERILFPADKSGLVIGCTITKNSLQPGTDLVAWVLDSYGNLISLTKNDVVKEYTYYHVRGQVEVETNTSITKEPAFSSVVHSMKSNRYPQFMIDFFNAAMWVPRFFLDKEYKTVTETTVLKPDTYEYPQALFHLPSKLEYSEDPNLFTKDLESEFTYRFVESEEDECVVLDVTYYGYQKVTPKGDVKNLTASAVVLPKIMLEVRAPDALFVTKDNRSFPASKATRTKISERLDALVHLYKVAQLHKQEGQKKKLQAEMTRLRALMSVHYGPRMKTLRIGLNSFSADSMTITELSYITDVKSSDFGRPSKTERYLLDGNGQKILSSLLETSFSYKEYDVGLEALTQVKGSGVLTKTAQIFSPVTGKLIGTVDSQKRSELLTYNSDGLLSLVARGTQYQDGKYTKSEMFSRGYEQVGSLLKVVTANEVHGGTAVTEVDALGRERSISLINETKDDKGSVKSDVPLKLKTVEYDKSDRVSKEEVIDYDAGGEIVSTVSKIINYEIVPANLENGPATSWFVSHENAFFKQTETVVLYNSDKTEVDRKVTQSSVRNTKYGHKLMKSFGGSAHSYESHFYSDDGFQISSGMLFDTGKLGTGKTLDRAKATLFENTESFDKASELTGRSWESVQPGTSAWRQRGQETYGYDSWGRVIKSEYFETPTSTTNTAQSTVTYDNFGRATKIASLGLEVTKAYSSTLIQPFPEEITVRKNAAEAAAVKFGKNEIDALGRVTKQTVFGRVTGYEYTGAERSGRKIGSKSRLSISNLTSAFDGGKLEYTERYGGQLKYTTTHSYSVLGKLLKFTGLDGLVTRYQYDAYGRCVHTSSKCVDQKFTYSDVGRLETETIIYRRDGKDVKTLTVNYEYNAAGVEIRRTFNGVKSGKPLVLSRVHDQQFKLLHTEAVLAGTRLSKQSYAYHSTSNRLAVAKLTLTDDKSGVTETFTHDDTGNLKQFSVVLGKEKDSTVFVYKDSDPTQLLSVALNDSTWKVKFDDLGNRVEDALGAHTFTDSGTLGSASGYTFEHDDQNRLRKVFCPGFYEEYHYRSGEVYARVQCIWDEPGKSVSEREDKKDAQFYWRRSRLLNESGACVIMMNEELDATGKLLATYVTSELKDVAGSVIYSIPLYFSAKGDHVISRSEVDNEKITPLLYMAYGHRSHSPLSYHWLGFNGLPLDALGRYHLGNGRVYDPETAQMLSPDPLSPFDEGGLNPYAYCKGDPINYQDPSGYAAVVHQKTWTDSSYVLSTSGRVTLTMIGLMLSPFTGGLSHGFSAGLFGLGVGAAGFEVASIAVEESDPELAQGLSYVSAGFGVAGFLRGVWASRRMATSGLARAPRNKLTTWGGNMRNATMVDQDLYTFVDTYKAADRLNIAVHGTGMGLIDRYVLNRGSSIFLSPTRQIDAAQLLELLRNKGIDPDNFANVRMITCFSANGGAHSVAANFRGLIKPPVKGYVGPVTGNFEPGNVTDLYNMAQRIDPATAQQNFASVMSRHSFSIKKTNPFNPWSETASYISYRFEPVKFL
jgi:RHS repeat-associated protein